MKEKKKKAFETAPSFEANRHDDWLPIKPGTPVKRHTTASRAAMHKTLRGIRR